MLTSGLSGFAFTLSVQDILILRCCMRDNQAFTELITNNVRNFTEFPNSMKLCPSEVVQLFKKFRSIVEPKVSLPYSQAPDKLYPYLQARFPYYIYIESCHPCLDLQSELRSSNYTVKLSCSFLNAAPIRLSHPRHFGHCHNAMKYTSGDTAPHAVRVSNFSCPHSCLSLSASWTRSIVRRLKINKVIKK
jgi:hypothetical protein